MTESWDLDGKAVTVGRGATADVKVNDEGLSRRHFKITREDEEYVLKDLSSRNGTWVEGERASAVTLDHNAAITAGRSQFRFCKQAISGDTSFRPRTGPHDTVIIPLALLACDS